MRNMKQRHSSKSRGGNCEKVNNGTKMQRWKLREMETAAQKCSGGKCEKGNNGTIQKLYSLTNIVRAFQSKLRNSKNHFGVDTRYVNVYSCPYKTSFSDYGRICAILKTSVTNLKLPTTKTPQWQKKWNYVAYDMSYGQFYAILAMKSKIQLPWQPSL